MNSAEIQNYLIPVAILLFFGWRLFRFRQVKGEMMSYLESGAIVVDVRTAGEYAQGHAANSLNIPLNELANRLNEISKNKMVVLCCASGARSGMALALLKKNGFQQVINAGPWTNTLVG